MYGGTAGDSAGAFRNCQVAAPLKPAVIDTTLVFTAALPQLSSCGPIEALVPCAGALDGSGLPQLSSCGPIEASRADCTALADLAEPSATVKLRPH